MYIVNTPYILSSHIIYFFLFRVIVIFLLHSHSFLFIVSCWNFYLLLSFALFLIFPWIILSSLSIRSFIIIFFSLWFFSVCLHFHIFKFPDNVYFLFSIHLYIFLDVHRSIALKLLIIINVFFFSWSTNGGYTKWYPWTRSNWKVCTPGQIWEGF